MNEPSAKPRILMIDDDHHVRRILSIGLRLEGFDVEQAENGQKAVEKLQQIQVDAIVADLMMPVMDGRSFLKIAREQLGSGIPIIMLTSMDRPDAVSDLMQCGASGILHKPVLATRIAEMLRKTG